MIMMIIIVSNNNGSFLAILYLKRGKLEKHNKYQTDKNSSARCFVSPVIPRFFRQKLAVEEVQRKRNGERRTSKN